MSGGKVRRNCLLVFEARLERDHHALTGRYLLAVRLPGP